MKVNSQTNRCSILDQYLFHTVSLNWTRLHDHNFVVGVLNDGVVSVLSWDGLLQLSLGVSIIYG